MDPYDISRIFVQMEHDLIASMKRNFVRHLAEEAKEGFEWEQWQQRKLQALASYRAQNKKLINAAGKSIDRKTEALLQDSFRQGGKNVDGVISRLWNRLKHIFIAGKLTKPITQVDGTDDSFFKLNEKRVNSLINAVTQDLQKGRYAMLRQADDVYRQTILKSQLYLNSGASSLGQAIDMATKDFLDRGFNCIVYKDGKRVNIASYAEMALRTSSQRAVLTGEGARREEWGVSLVVVSAHANTCAKCLPWQGKVYIDDVYSGGKKGQGSYPLLSAAMCGGLFHPHCRHNTGTYFEGISELPESVDDEKALANYDAEQKQRYMERQIRMYKRHEVGDVDPKNQADASGKVREWQGKIREHLTENPQLRRDPRREQIKGGLNPKQRNENLKKDETVSSLTPLEKIRKAEDGIRNDNKESAIVFDQKGNELWRKEGNDSDVNFTGIKNKGILKGNIVTHNHPGIYDESFSRDDVQTMLRTEMGELRAVTKNYDYSIKLTDKFKTTGDLRNEKFTEEMSNVFNQKIAKYRAQIKSKEISVDEAVSRVNHELWEDMANKTGWVAYKRDLRHDLKLAARDSKIKETRDSIKSDAQPKKLEVGQQNKHIPSTNEYKQYQEKFAKKDQYGPSKVNLSPEELQDLVNKHAGTGEIRLSSKGEWNQREIIYGNDKIVGKVVNNLTGVEVETTVFKIHYGKKGVHIVPDYPSKKKGGGKLD